MNGPWVNSPQRTNWNPSGRSTRIEKSCHLNVTNDEFTACEEHIFFKKTWHLYGFNMVLYGLIMFYMDNNGITGLTELVGGAGCAHLEKIMEFVHGFRMTSHMKWKIKVMFETTNQITYS